MNRKKKINQILIKKQKKKNAKLHKKPKEKYISKADREELPSDSTTLDSESSVEIKANQATEQETK